MITISTSHGLCKDKKDIILSEIQACESLMNDTSEVDKKRDWNGTFRTEDEIRFTTIKCSEFEFIYK